MIYTVEIHDAWGLVETSRPFWRRSAAERWAERWLVGDEWANIVPRRWLR
jgi:hypothetical protein